MNPTRIRTPQSTRFSVVSFGRWTHAAIAVLLLALSPGWLTATEAPNRIVNFSARAAAGTGENTVILGFVVKGNADRLLVRALGPTLQPLGVTNASADPRLTVFSGQRVELTNDNWTSAAVAPATGALPLLANSKDAAILSPFIYGQYTAHVTTPPGDNGVVMAELFDAQTYTAAPLANVSARAQTGSGESTFVTGFVVDGVGKKTVLLRAVGPGLSDQGVAHPLADPRIEVFAAGVAGGGSPFAVNDDWNGSMIAKTAMQQAGAFPLAAQSKDAAMLLTLDPGCYTAHVTGAGNAAGVALFELYDSPITKFPLTSANNVIYRPGDFLKFGVHGAYRHADGSETRVTGGWFRLEVVDQGLTNPLNHDLPVLSLVETLLYVGVMVSADGAEVPVRIVGYPTTRYYVQDAQGTIRYQGERVPEGVDASGAPKYRTSWFPSDFVQFAAPFVVGEEKTSLYSKQAADGTVQSLGKMVTNVEATETASTPLGKFETYRIRAYETSRDPGTSGAPLASRLQYVSPDLGIIRFEFFSLTPGDTGTLVMELTDTNLPYLGANRYTLAEGNRLASIEPGRLTRFLRSGYYIGDDGTIEDLSGWFTMEVKDEGMINPATNRRALTLVETHHTEIEATTIEGVVSHQTQHQVFSRYAELNAAGEMTFVGDTGPDGSPVWFDHSVLPLPFPYSIGQTKTQTVTAANWSSGQAVPLFSYTATMKVSSLADVRTTLGTFECYRMDYHDSAGYIAEQYTYPAIGVVKFSYPAPAGKSGHMDLTLTSTNIPFR